MSTICRVVFNSLSSVEIAVDPGAGMGMGEYSWFQLWLIDQRNQHEPLDHKATVPLLSVGFSTHLNKNATDVSAVQQAYVFVLMATFSPTECLIATVSYLSRAAPDEMEPSYQQGRKGQRTTPEQPCHPLC
jgi:hypothetical protein